MHIKLFFMERDHARTSMIAPKNLLTIATYILAMATTIQISEDLLNTLKAKKMHDKESYEDIIWCLLEDSMEFSEETKKNIAEAEADIKAGRVISFGEFKKKHGYK